MVHSWLLIYKLYAYCIIYSSFSGDRLTDERVQGAQQAMNFLRGTIFAMVEGNFFTVKFEEIILYG